MAQDLDTLIDLNKEVQDLHFEALPEQFKSPSACGLKAALGEMLNQEDTQIFIGYVEESPAGYMVIRVREREENGFRFADRWLEVDHVCVRQKFRSQGYGRQFIEVARNVALEMRIDRLELSVWTFNGNARKAFKAVGFVPVTERMALPIREAR